MDRRVDSAGQSEIVGVVLLLTLVLLGISVIAVTGVPTLQRMQENVQTERVQNEFSTLDAEISEVTFGGAAARTVRMNTGSSSLVIDNSSGWVDITVQANNSSYSLYNRSLGKIQYGNNGEIIGYQGGGVWRTRAGEEGTGVVSPPEFRFRGSTLTFPILRINSSGRVSGSAAGDPLTVHRDEFNRIYPNSSKKLYPGSPWNRTNPLPRGRVTVTVHSRFYQGWANYFRESASGPVSTDIVNRTASVNLTVPQSTGFTSGVLASGADAGTLEVGNKANLATYDSDDGHNLAYSEDIESNCSMSDQKCDGHDGIYSDGEIRTTGTVVVENQAKVFGSIISTDDITVDGGEVAHDIISAEDADDQSNGVYGNVTSGADVEIEDLPNPDPVVRNEINSAKNHNNNSEYGLPNDGDTDLESLTDSNAIGHGKSQDQVIYLKGDVEVSKVEFDLSGGNVTVAVDGNLDFMGDSWIDNSDPPAGNNSVTWYVNGNLEVTQGNKDVLSDEDLTSWRNFFMVSSSGSVSVTQQGNLVGTVFAPRSTLDMGNQRTIYGALIVEDFNAGQLNKLDIFYDKDLKGRRIEIIDPKDAVTYMHVTETKISVE